MPRKPGGPTAEMFIAGCSTENFTFGTNWISPGWRYSFSAASKPYSGITTHLGDTVSPSNNDPGFLDLGKMDLRLRAGSTSVGIGGSLAPEVTNNDLGLDLTPTYESSYDVGITPRTDRGAGSNAGAFGLHRARFPRR
jgi:hypothetical protein